MTKTLYIFSTYDTDGIDHTVCVVAENRLQACELLETLRPHLGDYDELPTELHVIQSVPVGIIAND
jgi:hypothetical protein